MTNFIRGSILFCAMILMGMSFVACLDGGSQERTTGTLELNLVDNPGDYQEVVITISEVQVHHETDGWTTLSGDDLNVPLQINLLDLVNGTMAYIGATELQPGHYTQMRLILDDAVDANYLVIDDQVEYLKIPSGFNTGVKLVNGFDIAVAGATELLLDFDVDKSIVRAGNSGKHLLKPTIKVVDTVTNSVSGLTLDDGAAPLQGVKVSAQKNSSGESLDIFEPIDVPASTDSDEFGGYLLYLPLLDPMDLPYNIVAVLSGYFPACETLPADEETGYNVTGEFIQDFSLSPVGTELEDYVTFSVQIQGLEESESVTINIRYDYGGDCGLIEVAALNRGNTMPSEELITLPAGDYQIIVTSEDVEAPDPMLVEDAAGDYLIDLDFTPEP